MKKYVFIESNTTGTGKIFVTKAIQKGYEIIFLCENSDRYPFLSDLMIIPVKLNTADSKEIISYLKTLDEIQAVFSSSEYYIEVASEVANYFDLPCNNIQAIRDCRDKLSLCHKLISSDVYTPKSLLVTNWIDAKNIVNSVQFPVVLKPASGSGSVGVKLCKTFHEYDQHMKYLLAQDKNERGVSITPRVLVQEYIEGSEYSVEILLADQKYHVIGITQKYLGMEPYFVEVGHDFPAVLGDQLKETIEKTVVRAMSILGFTLGAAHVEFRIARNNVYIIEINPRLAGGMIPMLIEEALGTDILDLVLDIYAGVKISCEPSKRHYSSIRFVIPEYQGFISKLDQQTNISNIKGIKSFALTKKVGEQTTCLGDYRDRIGYVISTSDNIDEARKISTYALSQLNIKIDNNVNPSVQHTGRIAQTLHHDAMAIVNKGYEITHMQLDLNYLVAVDESHLIMLLQQKIVAPNIIKRILLELNDLKNDNYLAFNDKEMLRGIYLLYESVLIERLGMEIGGVIHTGRSRNDINATLFKLKTRDLYLRTYQALWKLRSIILQKVIQYIDITMPIYSQFQTALPGKYAFYLLAIADALARDQLALKNSYDQLAISPLGAGAGAGTSFPINPILTAKLLGFETCQSNALDAVASRDVAVRLLSCLSILGMTVSRIAQDYQLWTTQEFAFFTLSDTLVGGSSMMPQKKNPYLLEKIKGKAIIPTGNLMTMLATMQKTPFSNSVEVGTEALVDFDKSFDAIQDSLNLMRLVIDDAKPVSNTMKNSSDKGLTQALCITEALSKSGIPFRQAHYKVGDTIRLAIENNHDPKIAIEQLVSKENDIDWSETFNYGGGCSSISINNQYQHAISLLKKDGEWIQNIVAFWHDSNILRESEIKKILFN